MFRSCPQRSCQRIGNDPQRFSIDVRILSTDTFNGNLTQFATFLRHPPACKPLTKTAIPRGPANAFNVFGANRQLAIVLTNIWGANAHDVGVVHGAANVPV